jgi:hypothetical protein
VDLLNIENALSPTNDSERLLFRSLFYNVVQLDCQGAVRPGVAESWTSDSGGRVWTFKLRERVGFQRGRPISADLVAGSMGGPHNAGKALGIASVVALDERHARVSLGRQLSSPGLFADPALALITGTASTGPDAGGQISIPARAGMPAVVFHFQSNTDARDALDRADLVVTRDPALVDYAKGLPEFATFPLPWSRTYALLQPANAEPLDAASAGSGRGLLAQDAVRADARAAEPPFWWNEVASCPERVRPGSTPTSSRVAYIRGDEVGRGLAERIVALARSGTSLRTEALAPAEFITRLRSGSELAYVVSLPRQTLALCREAAGLPDGARIQPLIDTRAHAIVRKGVPPLTVEWDGTVRVVEP